MKISVSFDQKDKVLSEFQKLSSVLTDVVQTAIILFHSFLYLFNLIAVSSSISANSECILWSRIFSVSTHLKVPSHT
jgi:hypothetical protein